MLIPTVHSKNVEARYLSTYILICDQNMQFALYDSQKGLNHTLQLIQKYYDLWKLLINQ